MLYIIAAAIAVTLVVVAVAIWRRASEADSALERVDAYIDHGRVMSRLADACTAR